MTAAAAPAAPLVYRVHWRGRSVAPGGHKASLVGPGQEFHLQAPYGSYGETRKLDLRAAAADPQERIWVKVHRQPASVPVVVLADVSRSMSFRGTADRWSLLLAVIAGVAAAAARAGDRFGLVACDEQVRRELSTPPVRSAAVGREMLRRLHRFQPSGRSAAGLLHAVEWLPPRRALVLLVSDLHLPSALFERLLRSLALHDVVPIVLADSREQSLPRRFGLARLQDLESGRERLLWLRASLGQRLAAQWLQRAGELRRIALRFGRAPMLVQDRFEPLQFNRYFAA